MTDSRELYPGRKLGRYELLVPLAQGATAEVWAARMTGSLFEKIVAIKAMLTEVFADVELDAESMFLDEARLVSRIRHPNVGSVLDLGEEDDALYIVMDWVEGEPLQVVMREAKSRGIPLPLALRIVKQAASGLHAAHELCDESGKPVGLVHRDVSPQNLLVGYDGVVKVIDFGVAKAESNLQRTSVGQIKGKVPYMAPEQAIGDHVDRRTDVFALGVVLYQLVTGKHPFRADSEFATLARIRDKNPADSPRKHVPDLPVALEEVMLKVLAKQRDSRYSTMLDLGRALERAVPSPPDVDRALGVFISGLLSARATKREASIREALREQTGKDTRPVNLGVRPVYEERSSSVLPVEAQMGEAAGLKPPEVEASLAAAPAPEVIAAPSPLKSASFELPEGMRAPRPRALLVAGLIAVVLVLILAVWAVVSAVEGAPVKRSF
jgi:eukaryotic-like serine/threonine-protein kinase